MATFPFQAVSDAETAIQAHPLCAEFLTTPTQFVVYYPSTYTLPGGVTVKRGSDDLAALNLLWQRLENFWTAQTLQVSAQ
jgi:hypothetical protein